jgi:hypothetical protein
LIAYVDGICSPLIVSTSKSRNIVHSQIKAIELIAHMKIDYNAMSYTLKYFSLLFDPPLKQNEDYEIDYLKPENNLPVQYRQHKSDNITLFAIILKPGKMWVKDIN